MRSRSRGWRVWFLDEAPEELSCKAGPPPTAQAPVELPKPKPKPEPVLKQADISNVHQFLTDLPVLVQMGGQSSPHARPSVAPRAVHVNVDV